MLETRKLGMWGALPAYLGGKRRLCPTIFREVDRILPRRHWPGLTFLDAFLACRLAEDLRFAAERNGRGGLGALQSPLGSYL
jgi:hypothetical protein